MVILASAASAQPQGSYLNLLFSQEGKSTLSRIESILHFSGCALESEDWGAIGGGKN